jgi:hypothetical protein
MAITTGPLFPHRRLLTPTLRPGTGTTLEIATTAEEGSTTGDRTIAGPKLQACLFMVRGTILAPSHSCPTLCPETVLGTVIAGRTCLLGPTEVLQLAGRASVTAAGATARRKPRPAVGTPLESLRRVVAGPITHEEEVDRVAVAVGPTLAAAAVVDTGTEEKSFQRMTDTRLA